MAANAFGVTEQPAMTVNLLPGDAPPSMTPDGLQFPLAPDGSMGPPTEYGWLQKTCPVARLAVPEEFNATMWYATRHADVAELLADPRFIRPTINEWPEVVGRDPETGPPLVTMMELEGPDHLALRRTIAEAFSPKAIATYLPRMRARADELLDRMIAGPQPADFVPAYLEPFPLRIMCDLVGMPWEDQEYFLPLADVALGAMQTWAEGRDATGELLSFVQSVIAQKRRQPADDILSRVIQESRAGAFGEDAVLAFGLSMLVAGYRTTTMFLGNSMVLLLSEPSRYALLRDDRQLLRGAVEELLRFIPVMNGIVVLLATEDMELHGRRIGRGEAVLPVIAAANRDAAVFSEPDELNLRRAENPHIIFGRGSHNCLGQQLARMEMTVGLDAVLEKLPSLRLADEHPAEWDDEAPAKSPLSLHVHW